MGWDLVCKPRTSHALWRRYRTQLSYWSCKSYCFGSWILWESGKHFARSKPNALTRNIYCTWCRISRWALAIDAVVFDSLDTSVCFAFCRLCLDYLSTYCACPCLRLSFSILGYWRSCFYQQHPSFCPANDDTDIRELWPFNTYLTFSVDM